MQCTIGFKKYCLNYISKVKKAECPLKLEFLEGAFNLEELIHFIPVTVSWYGSGSTTLLSQG